VRATLAHPAYPGQDQRTGQPPVLAHPTTASREAARLDCQAVRLFDCQAAGPQGDGPARGPTTVGATHLSRAESRDASPLQVCAPAGDPSLMRRARRTTLRGPGQGWTWGRRRGRYRYRCRYCPNHADPDSDPDTDRPAPEIGAVRPDRPWRPAQAVGATHASPLQVCASAGEMSLTRSREDREERQSRVTSFRSPSRLRAFA
jgi:hypothetical protein